MNRFFFSCLLASLLFIVPAAVFLFQTTEYIETEQRRASTFPSLPSKLSSGRIKKFFRGIDTFFADQFPLRTHLLALSMTVYEIGRDNANMDKCYRGKQDWLFLGNSYARVEELQGTCVLEGANLQRHFDRYVRMRDAAAQKGAEFFVFIGPNKSSIYPELLPPVIVPAKKRFISPLVDKLHAAGVQVYDPSPRLYAAKPQHLQYFRTDTHWNSRGAYEAFEGFRQMAGIPPLPPLFFEEGETFRGDLVSIGGYRDFPLTVGDNFHLRWRVPLELTKEAGMETDAQVKKGGLKVTNAQATTDKTVWVFGDSFAETLKPYISASFKEVRHFGHIEFDTAMSSAFQPPDVVLWVVVERNFAW